MSYKILNIDPYLSPYESDIRLRMDNYHLKLEQLLSPHQTLCDFANAHEYFGFHKTKDGWYYREWAPKSDRLYLMGDMNGWDKTSMPLTRLGNGVWEIFLEGDVLYDGCHVKTVVEYEGQLLERIPLYATRVVQDDNGVWCATIVDKPPYHWSDSNFVMPKTPYIYECHIGMAQEKEGIGTYREFADLILPRIAKLGYNTIQIMAIMEHPYYGSFGYQVSSFFAPSSRYGDSDDLKYLIDTAHRNKISVLLDVVHSHAVKNTVEGINQFDGSDCQFFHVGARGEHSEWGTKLFNYAKPEVIHFLLSNLKYWLTEYHFDGFRFDGVTSMIYHDHGLGGVFGGYDSYFSLNTDTEAITYLQLANDLIRQVNPQALTIAEDMSAMPGMCLPIDMGGIGFDYRLAMGLPDMWIRLVKDTRDEDWNMWSIYHELTSRRPLEKYIAYTESHDQALVGDKTLIFRLCDSEMYTHMSKFTPSMVIDRGIALLKLMKLLTLTAGGEGYLNFMGNEFGHPEWIDFPREGNGWSYKYCRRQWHLVDDHNLKYHYLLDYDRALIRYAKSRDILSSEINCISIDDEKKVLVYERGGVVFAVNLHPSASYENYRIPLKRGKYKVTFSSDDEAYGGWDRISTSTVYHSDGESISVYLPARTAMALTRTR